MCMIKEVWKDIPNFEGRYKISNYGNVLSLPKKTTKGGILKNKVCTDGYLENTLIDENGKSKYIRTHRLMAMAFLENPNDYPIINHKNEVKDCNFIGIVDGEIVISNLEWCTYQYNNTYNDIRIRTGEKYSGENSPNYGKKQTSETIEKRRLKLVGKKRSKEICDMISDIHSKAVLQYSLDGIFIKEWKSARQVTKESNIHYSHISSCCKGKRNKCGGFLWFHKDNFTEQLLFERIEELNKPNWKCKTVLQYTLDGEFVKEWESASKIENELGFISSCITACCLNKTRCSYNYLWFYKDNFNDKVLNERINDINKPNSKNKPIIQLDLQGNFIREWQSIKEARETLRIESSGISACCKKKKRHKTYKGFIWVYKSDYIPTNTQLELNFD